MNSSFVRHKVLVLGGSSGMGLESARLVLEGGGSPVITGSARPRPKRRGRHSLRSGRSMPSTPT